MLPNTHLLAKAFHRPFAARSLTRQLSSSPTSLHKEGPAKGIGSTGKDHVTSGKSKYNPQADGAKSGTQSHERSQMLEDAASERDTHRSNVKGERDYPEAPRPVLGLNDERGTKGALNGREGMMGKKK